MSTTETVSQNKISRQIKGEIYDSLRTALVAPSGKSKTSWTDEFIQKMLKEAKSNPSGPLGQLIAKQLLQEDIISSLDEQTEKLLSRDYDFIRYRILKQLYDKQRDVLLDKWIARKIVMCSRRAGKTNLAARMLCDACVEPNMPTLYINTKFENAITQCFQLCVDAAEEAEMVIEKQSTNDGIIVFANGSSITFKGNPNKAAAGLMRGGKYKLIIVDEIQSQCNLNELIYEVLEPMLVDYENSCLMVCGTPPRLKKTWCEKIWNQGKWKKYHFTMFDNPFLKNTEQYVKDLCKEKGIDKKSPFILREYYGEMGVYDIESQVFKDYKTYTKIPDKFVPTDIAIGADYGFSDYNSIIALAYNRQTKQAYVIAERKFNQSTVSFIVESCREVYEQCKKFAIERNKQFDLGRIGFYCDTNEQSISQEMAINYKLPVFNCYKYDKKMAISQLADWVRSGRILTKKNGIVTDEFDQTLYKRDEEDNITSEIDDDLFHPDAVDALLYASRQYAFDCGEESGGQSSDKIKKEEARQNTLPEWINQDEGEDNNDY